MPNQSKLQLDNKGALCSWCERTLISGNMAGESVCMRCYQMLRVAGIKEEEIFSAKTSDSASQVKAATNCKNNSS